jgi:hypothetical protein
VIKTNPKGDFQMTTLAQVAKAMREVLTTQADRAGRSSGLIQRARKLQGSTLAQLLVFGWMANPEATLEALAQSAATLGVPITAQAIDARFTAKAADFLKSLLSKSVAQVIAAQPVALDLLQRFSAVLLQDSTTIALPAALAEAFQACGNGTPPSAAALKLHLQIDLLRGGIKALLVTAACASDAGNPVQHLEVEAGALRLADLGYWDTTVFLKIAQQGGYYLSRLKTTTVLHDAAGQRIELLEWLAASGDQGRDARVYLGRQKQELSRLVAARVPPEVEAQRRRKLQQEARRKGRTLKQSRLALAAWTIYVTNVEVEKLSAAEVLKIGRVRWQIELIFKLWKSYGKLAESRSRKPWRILCEMYAKLIGLIVAHWVMVVSLWKYADKSLMKALQTISCHALHLAAEFGQVRGVCRVLEIIARCLRGGCRINKRKAKPHSFQLLQQHEIPNPKVGINLLRQRVPA